MKTALLCLLLLIAYPMRGLAQLSETLQRNAPETMKGEEPVPFQLTFVYPLGTGGTNTLKTDYDYSFNLLVGINNSINKWEMGGLVNINLSDSKGAQFGGILNLNRRNYKGFQMGGIANICGGNYNGTQFGGIANITPGTFTGFRMGGIVNYSKELKGLQFGLINIVSNSDSGTSVGLINIVKDGLYELELSTGEVLYSNLRFRMGVQRFYTVFAVGYTTLSELPVYSYGLGFGSEISLSEKGSLCIDATANQIFYDNLFESDSLNMLNTLNVNYRQQLGARFSLFAGPTFNYYISAVRQKNNDVGTLPLPYTIYEKARRRNTQSSWIGFHLGLGIRL